MLFFTLPAAERSISRGRILSNMTPAKSCLFGDQIPQVRGPNSPLRFRPRIFTFFPCPHFSETPTFVVFRPVLGHFLQQRRKSPTCFSEEVLLYSLRSEGVNFVYGLFCYFLEIFGLAILDAESHWGYWNPLFCSVFSCLLDLHFSDLRATALQPSHPKFTHFFWYSHFWTQKRV